MGKYKGMVTQEVLQESGVWQANGCNQYSFRNVGNVNVSIDNVNVLQPGETWEGPQLHPELEYFNIHKIDFDLANAPTFRMPVGGQNPPSTVVNPGDVIVRDTRLVVIKTKISS